MMGIQRDVHCSDCRVDTIETVIYDGSEIITELACCGLEVEYIPTDFADLISEG